MERVMARKLEGKVAVITGGSAGIGLATAKRFAEEGAFVFITGRRRAELDAAVKEIGPNAIAVQADAASLVDLTRLFDTVKAAKGRIDVVYARALDGVFSEGGTTLQFGVLTGTASGSPVEPSLPTAFPNAPVLRLAAITVPSLATRPSNQVQSGDVFDKRRAVAHFDGVRRLLTGDLIGDVGFVAGELRDSTLTATGTGIERWNGSTWDALIGAGAWVAFTPTMTGMSNNAGTFVARYRRIGKTIVMHIDFAPAATASLGSGAVTITGLPVAVSGSSARFTTATGYLFDASGVLRPITGLVSTTTMAIFGLSGNSLLNPGAAGYTWGNSSSLTMDVVYEGA